MTDETHGAPPADSGASGITFVSFVMSLARTAAVHFGDVADPVTGATGAVNPQAAQQMIAILALLEEKTRGNLTAEERRLLEQVIVELRLRYIAVLGGRMGAASPDDASRVIRP